MRLQDIDTPALILDMVALEANITMMSGFCRQNSVGLRPHAKTHKCAEIARRQMAEGAVGLTCAKVGEAEALVDAGIRADFLVANEIVGCHKITRLLKLASQTPISVAVDDAANVAALGAAASAVGLEFGILVDVNTGMNRCGLEPKDVAALAQKVAETPGLRFRGLTGYEGHAVFVADRPERERVTLRAMSLLLEARDRVLSAGIPVKVVSAAGSGTYDITGKIQGITELQTGSYVVMDTRYRDVGLPFQNALTVLATVISRPAPDRAVLDVGLKGITSEFGLPEVKGIAGVRVAKLSEEHAILAVAPQQDGGPALSVGDMVELIPSHGCTTINLHGQFHCVRSGLVDEVWPIQGRGRIQ